MKTILQLILENENEERESEEGVCVCVYRERETEIDELITSVGVKEDSVRVRD